MSSHSQYYKIPFSNGSYRIKYCANILSMLGLLMMTTPSIGTTKKLDNSSAKKALKHDSIYIVPSFDEQQLFPSIGPNHPSKSIFKHFIVRRGDQLLNGNKQLHFIGFNAPELHRIENDIAGTRHFKWPTAWEQENWISALVGAGFNVTRIYVFSVKQGSGTPVAPVHVEAPGHFNEEGFRVFDKLLQLCNQYGLRIIVPFVDNWDWWGGIGEYSAFRGKNREEFFSDPVIRNDFKMTISYVLNRVNVYTGIKYKDDKAILAWETGNELDGTTAEWLGDIAAYIKSIDHNHLVVDGTQTKGGLPHREYAFVDPNIDIMTNHYYWDELNVNSVMRDINAAKDRKPFFVGEFGLPPLGKAREVLGSIMTAIVDKDIAGGLVWGFRGHRREGGFYYHKEGATDVYSYHLPGFAENESYEERSVVNLVREMQAKFNRVKLHPFPPPSTPTLLPIMDLARISWKGSATARSYDIIRAPTLLGPWQMIGTNISDGKNKFNYLEGLFKDSTANQNQTYFYSIRAKNESGMSPFSFPITNRSLRKYSDLDW